MTTYGAVFDLAAAARAEMVREGFHLLPLDGEEVAAGRREIEAIRGSVEAPTAGSSAALRNDNKNANATTTAGSSASLRNDNKNANAITTAGSSAALRNDNKNANATTNAGSSASLRNDNKNVNATRTAGSSAVLRNDNKGGERNDKVKDLRGLAWSSIDNDTSRDLDQVEWAERTQAGIRVLVGIADVAAAVGKDTVLDQAAALQTQTVYTAVHNFPMLPNELSTDLTSLNEGQDRRAIVCEFTVTGDGGLVGTSLYEAWVRNGAQLAYSTVGPWLEGKARGDGRTDSKMLNDAGIQAQLRLQDEAAQLLHRQRVAQGALEFNRVEADPVVIDGKVQSIKAVMRNRASDLIADLMIASNETMARMLRESGRSSIRRVVRSPERWSRIVALVAAKGTALPESPDAGALNKFLVAQQASDPVHYPDLSLAIIKLMGPGEYVLAAGGSGEQPGHFGLAALDYTHSTAPNRRFADLVTQRIVKALLRGEGAPYSDEELAGIAAHCNERDAAARKVERAMQKRVAAVALGHLIGHQFTGVITGAKDKGTYIRIFDPPVEGKIVKGFEGLDVGDTATVTLSEADPVHAFIDFTRP